MNVLHDWTGTLGLLVCQVTVWTALGIALVAVAARRGPRLATEAVTGVPAGVVLLTGLFAMPWPAWRLSDATRTPPNVVVTVTPVSASSPGQGAPVPVPTVAPPAPAHIAPVTPAWWPGVLVGAALILAGFGLLRLALGLVGVWWCRRRSLPIRDAALCDLTDTLCHSLGLRRPVELRELRSLDTPATVGWHRPVILLPLDWRDWNEAERRAVLAHELAHIRRRDYAGGLVARLASAVHGYHPLVHWLARRLRCDQELAADALAAPQAGGAVAYARTLCRLALRRDDRWLPGLARTFLPARIPLTRRIRIVLSRNKNEVPVSARKRLGLGAVLVVLCLAIAGLRSSAGAGERPVTPAAVSVAAPAGAADGPEIGIEVRILGVSKQMAERLTKDYAIDCTATSAQSRPPGTAFLTDIQVFLLMEALQGDRQTNVLQAPKVTLFNGQASTIQVQDVQYFVTRIETERRGDQIVQVPKNEAIAIGMEIALQPTVSADRKFVSTKLRARLTSLDSAKVPLFPITTMITPIYEGGATGNPIPFTQFIQQPKITTLTVDQTISLPDGGSAMIPCGKRVRETVPDMSGPLNLVPGLRDWVQDHGRRAEDEYVVMLLTPRVLPGEAPTAEVITAPAPAAIDSPVKDVLVNVQETRTGSLLFGVGVNSDAGLTGIISEAPPAIPAPRAPAPGRAGGEVAPTSESPR